MKTTAIVLSAIIALSSCSVIRQGEVGVRSNLGKIQERILEPGPRLFVPVISRIIKVPVRTENIEVRLNLPSKEGLTIQSEISILYHIKPGRVPDILQSVGLGFENTMILPVFRSAAADVTSRFLAKDMHSGERATIEKSIRDQMMEILEDRGFIIENVLMKSISLPAGLAQAIEEKLQAEQEAQRMEFIKDKEKREAERKAIQAEGDKQSRIIAAQGTKETLELEAEGRANAIKIEANAQAEANDKLNKSLSPSVLQNRQIETFRELAKSGNTKVIITDGKTPLLGLPDGK